MKNFYLKLISDLVDLKDINIKKIGVGLVTIIYNIVNVYL
jgi:hypothetical protein